MIQNIHVQYPRGLEFTILRSQKIKCNGVAGLRKIKCNGAAGLSRLNVMVEEDQM